jgi:hypothetical protein
LAGGFILLKVAVHDELIHRSSFCVNIHSSFGLASEGCLDLTCFFSIFTGGIHRCFESHMYPAEKLCDYMDHRKFL